MMLKCFDVIPFRHYNVVALCCCDAVNVRRYSFMMLYCYDIPVLCMCNVVML